MPDSKGGQNNKKIISPFFVISAILRQQTKKKKMDKFITRNELIEKFLNFKKDVATTGVTFASITYKTDESQSRQVAGKKLLQKVVQTTMTLGADYEKKVNRIKEKKQGEEGDFTAQAMKGKHYVNGYENPVVCVSSDADNRDKFMLVMITENRTKPSVQLFHNELPISREDAIAKNFFAPAYFNEKPTAGRGEVDPENDFKFTTLGFNKILQIKFGGVQYVVTDNL